MYEEQEGGSRPVTLRSDPSNWPYANAACQATPRKEPGFREHRGGLILPMSIRQTGELYLQVIPKTARQQEGESEGENDNP